MTEPLNEDVVALWNSPGELVGQWESGEHALKAEHERMISDWVGIGCNYDIIADLGCGPGRLISAINPQVDAYRGFDGSTAMIQRAGQAHPDYSFTVVDIFNYVSDQTYTVAVMLDVAQHQNRPLDSLLRVMQLWTAGRYLISLLVGDVREVLSMSVVEPLSDLLGVLDQVTLNRMYMERCGEERFAWVLLDLSRQ
jgi:SAM-dependent methyltransferase